MPQLINRIGIGIFFCLLSLFCGQLISIYINSIEKVPISIKCQSIGDSNDSASITYTCLIANIMYKVNNTCESVCQDAPMFDLLYILPVIPLAFTGIGQLLTFLTVLEFICAQAPKDMKGFLIGIWYSQLCLKTIVINTMDRFDCLLQSNHWDMYNGAKGGGVFLSIITFTLVRKWYRYRERDEIVNEQAIIEDLYERELLLNADKSDKS